MSISIEIFNFRRQTMKKKVLNILTAVFALIFCVSASDDAAAPEDNGSISLPVGENKKPMPKRHGESVFHRRDKAAQTGRPYTRPSIAFHKGSLHYVQRVRIPHRGQGPSSVTQLPILTALHARFLLCSSISYTKK